MNPLTKEEENILIHKGTEPPFSGEYDNHYEEGFYICRACDNPLFTSEAKFRSGCGWPSFDECIEGSVKEGIDAKGKMEITCAKCGGHLGHVFRGEGYTEKDTRHCVNSLSIRFKKSL